MYIILSLAAASYIYYHKKIKTDGADAGYQANSNLKEGINQSMA
ncbi:hypothetical protein J2W55_003203 [Mucilaginibacter pocheonensis]|uniref:Uncharacterized protein n=1 Tax=Mucilaginibacter pocheonensis TaxID=398050 RepID=A0ABU1TEQ7_9SPHI|nr:hypothetical protein [Mucilaginibacter pocheonensis]